MIEPPPLVLVVDDTDETRRLMRRALEHDQFRVVEAATGLDAVQAVAAVRPDVVVLDLGLPDISGLDVARRIRASATPGVAETILLACSASEQVEARASAIEAGCDAFESKPFDIRSFGGRVREVIAAGRRST